MPIDSNINVLPATSHTHRVASAPSTSSSNTTNEHLSVDEIHARTLHARAHAPDYIPIVQGPFREPKINGEEVHHGYVQVSGCDPYAYDKSLEHLSKTPTMRSIWLQLEDGACFRRDALSQEEWHSEIPTVSKIITNERSKNLVNDDRAEIAFDPTKLVYSLGANGNLVATSPATLLGHEGVHLFHFISDKESQDARLSTRAGRFSDREELVTMPIEQELARATGEDERDGYHGVHFRILKGQPINSTTTSLLKTIVAKIIVPIAKLLQEPVDYTPRR